jgi:hypothetical protein
MLVVLYDSFLVYTGFYFGFLTGILLMNSYIES